MITGEVASPIKMNLVQISNNKWATKPATTKSKIHRTTETRYSKTRSPETQTECI